MDIGTRIKLIRKEANLTQGAFGTKIGISLSGVSSLEVGKNTPSEQTIRAICSEFNINRDWLVDGIGEMSVKKPLIPELIHSLRKFPRTLAALAELTDEELQCIEGILAKHDQNKK